MTFHVLFDLCDVGSVVNTATFSINSEEKHGEKTLFILEQTGVIFNKPRTSHNSSYVTGILL